MAKQEEGSANEALQRLAERLSEQAARIRELEKAADEHLHQQGDVESYKTLLQEKAKLLSGLADELQPSLEKLPGEHKNRVEHQLEAFAQSAKQALQVDSVFFMRQLLYPEDYEEGRDNDLERFIRTLRQGEGF
jgi:arginine utilization protein RocB